MNVFTWIILCVMLILTQDGSSQVFPDPPFVNLAPMSVFIDKITMSGFSSGGTMAQHMFMSHSSIFSGMATFSHAYYRCGPATRLEVDYDEYCLRADFNQFNLTWNPDDVLREVALYESQGLIDPTINLRNKKFYIYMGTRSNFFDLDIGLTALRIFEPFIQNPYTVRTRVQDAAQIMPTKHFGGPCTENGPARSNFFFANCGFSGAHEAINFLLGDVAPIADPPLGAVANLQNLYSFDQTQFFYGYPIGQDNWMDSVGYIYIPQKCHVSSCFLHLYFHGCFAGREYNGTLHLLNSGYLEVAELNNIILVAPQAIGNTENTIGCWDTYALTSPLYATKLGPQVTIVRNILGRLLGEGPPPPTFIAQTHILPPAFLQGSTALILSDFKKK